MFYLQLFFDVVSLCNLNLGSSLILLEGPVSYLVLYIYGETICLDNTSFPRPLRCRP